MKDYKAIWDNLSTSFNNAAFYVCCIEDEAEIRRNGAITAEFLRSALQITPADRVLEIGCGVARIGRELAQYCGQWHGADISGNMITYARQRTDHLPNVFLYELPDSSLRIFPDNYFDCVYSSIVFMHLDKIDVFNYIREAYRVLKPAGRAYFDTYNLLAQGAWEEFLKLANLFFSSPDRPGHISQFSTPQEFSKFMVEAGFTVLHINDKDPQLVTALVRKEPAPDEPHAEEELTRRPEAATPHTAKPVQSDSTYQHGQPASAGSASSAPAPAPRPDSHLSAYDSLTAYARHLESEVNRKNGAISELEERIRHLEKELIEARRPRLPWKRRR
jgi:ubiquinone/menaquinone biosynthesis C-methylase UbiE